MVCPTEGLTGRLVADLLVEYLNFPGACIVAGTMVAAALYLSTTFSFNTAKEWLSVRFAFVQAWRDRWANWKAARARKRELRQAVKEDAARAKELARAQKAAAKAGKTRRAALPAQKETKRPVAPSLKTSEAVKDMSGEMPGIRHGGFAELYAEPAPVAPSLWDEMPRAQVPDFEPEPAQDRRRVRARAGTAASRS